MKKSTVLALTAVTGVALATSVISPAYAWHPEGKITKYVQNVTTGGAMSDANTASAAVAAKPGDTLKYTVVVNNPAAAAANNDNDLAYVTVTDSLPNGVELVSTPSQRALSFDMGTIAPGKSVTKEYTVKVTAKKDMLVENKACFTGDSTAKDSPKNGCDVADVNVTVPPAPVTPPAPTTPTSAPEAPAPAPETPAELPNTGPANILVLGGLATIAGYAANILRLRFARSRAQ